MSEDLTYWAEHLEATIESAQLTLFDRVFVLSATNSTQDAARRLCASRPGAVVIAGRQLEGRGRLGRPWSQAAGRGLAVTFVLPSDRFDCARLAIASGVAVAEAIAQCLPGEDRLIGLRWPNDVVERERGRKLSGILIEVAPPLALVGIGINVRQSVEDWPAELAGRACSLAELGSQARTIEVAGRVLVELERQLAAAEGELLERWARRDCLRGSFAEFACGNETFGGKVVAISPLHEIVLADGEGGVFRLSAEQTSLIKPAIGGAVAS